MADVAEPREDPLPVDTGDVEDVERGVGDVPANRAAGGISVPAELHCRRVVRDHDHPLPHVLLSDFV